MLAQIIFITNNIGYYVICNYKIYAYTGRDRDEKNKSKEVKIDVPII